MTLTGKDDSIDDGNQNTADVLRDGDGNYSSPGLAAQTVTVTYSDDKHANATTLENHGLSCGSCQTAMIPSRGTQSSQLFERM